MTEDVPAIPTGTRMAPGAAMAAVCLLQAFAIVLQKTDKLDLADRESRTLLRLFHGYFGELVKTADADTQQNAQELLVAFHAALDQLEVQYDRPATN